MALAFALGGVGLLAIAPLIGPWTVLVASFVVGLSFAWKKIPSDTLVQESVPDGYRGRVFAVYDVLYQLSRLLAAFVAIWMLPALGEAWSVAVVGVLFLAWSPVLPRWLARAPELRLEFQDGDRTRPIRIVWGGVTEPVEVVASDPTAHAPSFRLAMRDGTTVDVRRDGHDWRIVRELEGDERP